MKRLFIFLLAIAAAVSCIDKEPFLYRIVTFGYVGSDGSLLADDGIKYVFPAGIPDEAWSKAPRVVAVIDATEQIADSTYNARLQQYMVPLYKAPVVLTDPQVPDSLGTADIAVSSVWYSGGCLNMTNVIRAIDGEKAGNHVINLMADMRGDSQDTLRFEVHHRTVLEEAPTELSHDYSFYSSFPIASLMPKRDSAVLKVSWTWEGKPASVSGKVKI